MMNLVDKLLGRRDVRHFDTLAGDGELPAVIRAT
jgi:hypothetical protein